MYTIIAYHNIEDYQNSNYVGWHYKFDDIHPNKAKNQILKLVNMPEGFSVLTCHDEVLNLFGHLIANKKVRPEDVEVILFDEDGKELHPHYDAEGYLNDYPYGFFQMKLIDVDWG